METQYWSRLAEPSDLESLVGLWWSFVQARTKTDPSLRIKSECDFPRFVERELGAPHTFCWLVEHRASASAPPSAVGCLVWYLDDEASDLLSPFEPRRCAKVLGLYVEPEHRRSNVISLLIDAGIRQAESLAVTDIDLLVSAEQTGLHASLERKGFARAAVQLARHYPHASPRAELIEARAAPSPDARFAPAVRAARLGHRLGGLS